jgi:tetratricopeptide (TPR) repeat protein
MLLVQHKADDAHCLTALKLRRVSASEQALKQVQVATDLNPDNPVAQQLKGELLTEGGHFDEAIACLRLAIELAPKNHETWNLLGNVLKQADHYDESIDAYGQSLQLSPGQTYVYSNLADLFEVINEPDRASQVIEQALVTAPGDPYLNFLGAKLDERKSENERALQRLLAVPQDHEDIDLRMGAMFLKARLNDVLARPEEAMESVKQANALLRTRETDKTLSRHYRQQIVDMTRLISPAWVASWAPAPAMAKDEMPAFLVGFPRSGTTLLEHILDGHPGIQTMEEKPAIGANVDQLYSTTDIYPARLGNLSADSIKELRQSYKRISEHYLERQPETLLLDKFPLNTVHIPLIHRLFPDARILFALRHPCDVCLSCIMQSFEPNPAMDNFYTLSDTVRFYTQVMKLWCVIEDSFPLNVHYVRYEALVDDLEKEAAAVLGFLDVAWDEKVLDHVATSRGKRIRTPSYRQVNQPIYRRSLARWQKYQAQFDPYMQQLAPYIERFGYAEGAS